MASKKKTHVAIKLLFLGFGLYAAFTLVSLQVQIHEKELENEALAEQIRVQKAENDEARSALESGMSDEVVARAAREKLGYVEPGERVFVDTSGK